MKRVSHQIKQLFNHKYENLCNKMDKETEKQFIELSISLDEYRDDFNLISYIEPLLWRDTFSIDYIINLQKILKFYKDADILLPIIEDHRYEFIKEYHEFEFTNCIAYEMAIRTDEFQKVKSICMILEDLNNHIEELQLNYSNQNIDLNSIKEELPPYPNDIQETFDKYLVNCEKVNDLKISYLKIKKELEMKLKESKPILEKIGITNPIPFLGQDMYNFTGDDFKLLNHHKPTLRVSHFNSGLERIIKYYLKKENIYKNENSKFLLCKNEPIEKIIKNIELYYIYNDLLRFKLSKDFDISILDKDIKNILIEYYQEYQYMDIKPNYMRPLLYFKNSKLVNLEINLNCPKEELVSLISKVKDDYDKQKDLIKTPLEVLDEKVTLFEKPNGEKRIPKSFKEKKEVFANMFCVYDLDKVLTPIFDKKNKEFKIKQKEKLIDRDEINPYSKEYLKSEISMISRIPETSITKYRTLMKEYIDKKKFVDLISGISKNN